MTRKHKDNVDDFVDDVVVETAPKKDSVVVLNGRTSHPGPTEG